MAKKTSFTWTPYFNIHDIFEVYPNVCPKTRLLLNEDGTSDERNVKLPDGGVRLRFLGKVPSWYEKRDKIYTDIFGPLTSTQPNPIEHLIQNKDDIFGGLYIYADSFYEPYQGSGYLGIGTSGRMSEKNGNDPFGCGTLSRIWKHCLKVLGRHEGCNIQLTGGWKRHVEHRKNACGDPLVRDGKFAFMINYDLNKQQLEVHEQSWQETRLGKFGCKFPINELPSSVITDYERYPF